MQNVANKMLESIKVNRSTDDRSFKKVIKKNTGGIDSIFGSDKNGIKKLDDINNSAGKNINSGVDKYEKSDSNKISKASLNSSSTTYKNNASQEPASFATRPEDQCESNPNLKRNYASDGIEITDSSTTPAKTYKIEYSMINGFSGENKQMIIDSMKQLPDQVLADLAVEINSINVCDADGIGGSYSSANDNINISNDYISKYVIAHELGHALCFSSNNNGANMDTLCSRIDSDPAFKKTYEKELKAFFDAYEEKYGKKHCWNGENGVSPAEIGATYYVLYSLGESDVEWADLMAESMPETTKYLRSAFDSNRELPDIKRNRNGAWENIKSHFSFIFK